jgi:hypothetical protein
MPIGEAAAAAAAQAAASRGAGWVLKQFGRTQLERLLYSLYKRHGRATQLYRDSFYAWAADDELRTFLEATLGGNPPRGLDWQAFQQAIARHLLRTPAEEAPSLAAKIAESAIAAAPSTVRSTEEVARLLAAPAPPEPPWLDPRLRPLERAERASALGGSGWEQTLEMLYPDWPLARLGEVQCPITALPAAMDEWFLIEAATGLLDPSPTSDQHYDERWDPAGREIFDWHHEADRWHLANDDAHSVHQWMRRHHDGPAFMFQRLIRRSSASWGIESGIGWYYQSLATSESLSDELLRMQLSGLNAPLALADLPRRQWLHEHVVDPVTDGSHRHAALSVATVIIWRSPAGWKILLSPRSKAVASDPYFDHVAPSGIFAPLNWQGALSIHAEYSVMLNILREYAEELYDRDDLERGLGLYDDVHAYPEIARLQEMLRDATVARLVYTGISVNLLTLRPEICTLLLIRDPDWLAQEARADRRPQLAWEYLRDQDKVELGRPLSRWLDLTEDFGIVTNDRIAPTSLVPNAAAAISLALPVAEVLEAS